MKLYNELVRKDLLVIEKYREIHSKDLLDANKQLREWINNLREECPNADDMEVMFKFLKDEYSIA